MKSKTPLISPHMIIFFLAGLLIGCVADLPQSETPKDVLKKALAEMSKINSATSEVLAKHIAPGDTVWRSRTYYELELRNERDTLLSARMATFADPSLTQFQNGYDGLCAASVYSDSQMVVVDSFIKPKYPFRTIRAPFYTKAERLVKYVLESKDSMTLATEQRADTIIVSVEVHDTVVEIIGTTVVYTPPFFSTHKESGNSSNYSIYIDAKTLLPIRLDREMPHDISQTSIITSELNTLENTGFRLKDFFPINYGVIEKTRIVKREKPHVLEGSLAQEWRLADADGDSISLADLRGKVALIEFTSVTCGPCIQAIPFLNSLIDKYEGDNFALVSIETLDRSGLALKHYRDRHSVKYPFLLSTPRVRDDYNVGPTPTFMVLDRGGKIIKVVQGYGKGRTEEKLQSIIEGLI